MTHRAPAEPEGFFKFSTDDEQSRIASGGMAAELNPRRSGVQLSPRSQQRGLDPDGRRNREPPRHGKRGNTPEPATVRSKTLASGRVSSDKKIQTQPIPATTSSASSTKPRNQPHVVVAPAPPSDVASSSSSSSSYTPRPAASSSSGANGEDIFYSCKFEDEGKESKSVPSPSSSPEERRPSYVLDKDKQAGKKIVKLEARRLSMVSGRAEFVCAVIWRESTNNRLGIGIKSKGGKLRVSSIKPDGPFDQSPLRVDDWVLKINEVSCVNAKQDEIVTLLRSHVGRLTILAHNQDGESDLVETTVKRPSSANSKVSMGIGMRQSAAADLEVAKAEGLFTDAPVEVGDGIVAVNQVECTDLPMDEVNGVIRQSRRSLTLRTKPLKSIHDELQLDEVGIDADENQSAANLESRDDIGGKPELVVPNTEPTPEWSNTPEPEQHVVNSNQEPDDKSHMEKESESVPSLPASKSSHASSDRTDGTDETVRRAEFVCAVIFRESIDDKLGISIKLKGGKLLVSRIVPDGPFDNTPLQVGDRVLKVNDVSLVDAYENDLIDILRSHVGRLTILAHNEKDSESSVVETVVKRPSSASSASSKAPMGIGMQQNAAAAVEVAKAEGLFTDAPVDAGDEVVAVNQVECASLSGDEVNSLISQSAQSLSLRTFPRKSIHDELQLEGSRCDSDDYLTAAKDEPVDDIGVKPDRVTSSENEPMDDTGGKPELIVHDTDPTPVSAITSITPVPEQDVMNSGQEPTNKPPTEEELQPVPTPTALPEETDVPLNRTDRMNEHVRRAEFVCAVIWRGSAEEKLGIGIRNISGKLLISRINPGGPFDETPLQVGDRVLKINDVSLMDADENDIVDLLRSHVGRLTILAHNEQDGEPSVVETMVKRPSSTKAKTSMGIGMRQNVDELLVSKADGLFTDAFVDPGDKIVAVNQVECVDLSMGEVNNVIRQSRRSLTLRTKPLKSVHEEFMLGEAFNRDEFDI